MTEYANVIIYAVFASVILAIAFNLVEMTLAGLLGLSVLTLCGLVVQKDVMNAVSSSHGSLSLLFGGMVVARVLAPTGVFDRIGDGFLRMTRGSGRRFLLLLVAMVSVVCAILPNATTVILLAPVIIRVCRALDVDIAGPMIVTAMASNAAGLLTLVGDPATFLVGDAIGMTFLGYMKKVSPGGVLAILAMIPLLPVLMPDVWRLRRVLPEQAPPKPIERPVFCAFAVLTLFIMVGLFLLGDSLPNPVTPPSAAIIAASLALLAIHGAKVDQVEGALRDIDWKTIIFIFCMMCYVELISKTGILSALSRSMQSGFGEDLLLAGLVLLASVGLASGFLANIPVVAAGVFLTKGYLTLLRVVPEEALGPGFTGWPDATLPVFMAMMFGGTLGGNATLIGASSNLVSAGACRANGRPVTFSEFMRYGVPVTLAQLVVSAGYLWILS